MDVHTRRDAWGRRPLAAAGIAGEDRRMRSGAAASILVLLAIGGTPAEARDAPRLPTGIHRGRCLYVVNGERRIAGPCFYRLEEDGSFGIDGPRQTYGGASTVDRGASALTYSRDWWADVYREDGGWRGYGNEAVADVHGGSPWSLRKQGACFLGEGVRICLWRR